MALLEIQNLHVALEDGTEIVKGVDLEVDLGQKHAIMGPNGSGKSTLAYALMGHPAYEVTKGQILLEGEDITGLPPHAISHKGIARSYQITSILAGASVAGEVVRQGRARKIIVFKFKRRKKYRRTRGHRQAQTTVRITAISKG